MELEELPSRNQVIFNTISISTASAIAIALILLNPPTIDPFVRRILEIAGPVAVFSASVALASELRWSRKVSRRLDWCFSKISELDREKDEVLTKELNPTELAVALSHLGEKRKDIESYRRQAESFRNGVFFPLANAAIWIMGIGLLCTLMTL
ncbi:hypothetical protein [Marinobacter nauticus]|uniref:SMODS and SLOG-associating 2TM effector domain-containing protein n=1 Tax=Marinobacter nauticus TaxID=2743 RepID=A0A368URP2_MARNT|nr:hypothetical protein [Marinobacter nauticus]RBP69753.1 hypothetical protein DET64_1119 [Marinobacter nauticus]RCW31466.1 hypothetical protein DET51_1119 [Marinobacter nauticus]